MAAKERAIFYKAIEEKRGNPLIAYVTSQRKGAYGSMASDVINEFIAQIEAIQTKEVIDVLIESTGGDPLASWRLISLLRANFKRVNVLVPDSAFSAATLFAMGADEIVMGRYGSLGPIDPQITTKKEDGTTQQFGFEDIASFLEFVKQDAGITEQQYIDSAFKKLCDVVSPPTLGFAKRSSSLSVSMGEKMLQMHMVDPEKKAQAKGIATKLNKSFFSHGHALSRHEAKEVGLNVVEPDKDLEELLWKVHQNFNEELQTRSPFDPLAVYLNDPAAKPLLQSPSPIQLPPQLNQQVAIQLLQQYISNQLNVVLPDVEVELKFAFVESKNNGSECFSRIRILVQRTLDMKFNGNFVQLEQGWRNVTME